MQRALTSLVLAMGLMAPLQAAASTVGSYVGELFVQQVEICDNSPAARGCFGPSFDTTYFQQIFDQVGILVTLLPTIDTVTTSLAPDGNGEVNPGDMLDAVENNYNTAPLPPFTVFAGFTPDLTGASVGLAYVDSRNGFAFNVPYSVTQSVALGSDPAVAARIQASILAHEIGHNLGGRHENAGADDLMAASYDPAAYDVASFINPISATNAALFLSSPLIGPAPNVVPLPGGLPLMAGGAMVLLVMTWRRRAKAA